MRWWVAVIIIVFFVLPVVAGLLGPESVAGAWLFDIFAACIVIGAGALVIYLIVKGGRRK